MANQQPIPTQAPITPPPVTLPAEVASGPAIEIGYAVSISNYLVWVNGLPNVRINEVVESEASARGLIVSIQEDLVGVLMLDDAKIKPQQSFKRTGKELSIATGSHLLGRTINPLGAPIDGKGGFGSLGQEIALEQPPTSIKSREKITRQFETGVVAVDMLVPLAYGQRELIIGDSHSGKTGFLIDTVVNQKDRNVICIYSLIGKPVREIHSIVDVLKGTEALKYTAVVASTSSDMASLVYLTPLVAVTLAEYFQKRGLDVILILDDMGVHAKFYREISLLSGKPPGRDSYPGDIFYQHAKLVERAGNFNKTYGGGSITALPVIETNLDDFSSYMTTNLMGMTDGHLLFSAARYRQGFRPSIDISLSVSRVGRQTQNLVQKALADRVKALISESARLQAYSRLGSEVSPQTQLILKQGAQIEIILKQLALDKLPILIQMILLGLVFTPFFETKDHLFVEVNKRKIINFLIRKMDLKKFQEIISRYGDDKQFIKSLESLGPVLGKVCAK